MCQNEGLFFRSSIENIHDVILINISNLNSVQTYHWSNKQIDFTCYKACSLWQMFRLILKINYTLFSCGRRMFCFMTYIQRLIQTALTSSRWISMGLSSKEIVFDASRFRNSQTQSAIMRYVALQKVKAIFILISNKRIK